MSSNSSPSVYKITTLAIPTKYDVIRVGQNQQEMVLFTIDSNKKYQQYPIATPKIVAEDVDDEVESGRYEAGHNTIFPWTC